MIYKNILYKRYYMYKKLTNTRCNNIRIKLCFYASVKIHTYMFLDYVDKMLPAARYCFASRIAEENSLLFCQNDRYF